MAETDKRIARLGFALREEQRMVAEAARELAQRRLAPSAAERDRTCRLRRHRSR